MSPETRPRMRTPTGKAVHVVDDDLTLCAKHETDRARPTTDPVTCRACQVIIDTERRRARWAARRAQEPMFPAPPDNVRPIA